LRYLSFSYDSTATFDDAYNRSFVRSASTHFLPAKFAERATGTVPLARLSADVGFVHFHDAFEQFALLKHRIANPHTHVPSRVFVHFQIAGELPSSNPFFRIKNQGDRQKPLLKRKMGVMKDRIHGDAEGCIAPIAMMAGLSGHRRGAGGFAVRADRSTVPANALNMSDAISFSRESFVDCDDVHGYPLLGRQKYGSRANGCQEKSSTLN
jgi:hypothetical protein